VVELGCGIGVLGLVGTLLSHPSLLVLTDREVRGRGIVHKNIQHFSGLTTTHTFYQQLRWGDQEDAQKVLELCTKSESEKEKLMSSCYDVVLGSELMYFNTDVDIMVQSVMALTHKKGLFIHGHLFRGNNNKQNIKNQIINSNVNEYIILGHQQEHQLITLLAAHNWTTVEIPHKEFISAEELKQHGEWYRTRPLISGPEAVVAKLVGEHPSWREFKEVFMDESDKSEQDEFGIVSLFK
jgi:hypothetical protein